MRWFALGNCAGMGADWHALHPDQQKLICWHGRSGRCPVMDKCWAECQTGYESWAYGTWGGLKDSERRQLGGWGEDIPHPGREAGPPPRGNGPAATVEFANRGPQT